MVFQYLTRLLAELHGNATTSSIILTRQYVYAALIGAIWDIHWSCLLRVKILHVHGFPSISISFPQMKIGGVLSRHHDVLGRSRSGIGNRLGISTVVKRPSLRKA